MEIISLKKSSQKFTKNLLFRWLYYVKGVPKGQIWAEYHSNAVARNLPKIYQKWQKWGP